MGRIAGRGTNKLQNKLYRAGLSLGVFTGTFMLAFIVASVFAPVDPTLAAETASGGTAISYDFTQRLDISTNKSTVGMSASGTYFDKMLTDHFNVTVNTNNTTGFVLSMATDSSATNGANISDASIGGTGGATGANVATNALVNTDNNKYYLPSITSSITNPTDSTFPTNSWAYSLNATDANGNTSTGTGTNGSSNVVYNPLPNAGSSAEIKKVTSLTLTEDSSGYLTAEDITPITIAAKADATIPAGNYTNKLVFTAITNYNPVYDAYTIVYYPNGGTGTMEDQYADPGKDVTLSTNKFTRTDYKFLGWSTSNGATTATYADKQTIAGGLSDNAGNVITLYAIWVAKAPANTIVYNANGADGGDMSMVTHTNIASKASVQLYAQNYWRKGYGFAGWSEDPYAASKLANGTSVTVYGPNETITASDTMSTEGMVLYATWIKSAGNMQGWQGCSSLATGAVTALTDTRDGDTYAVAKLKDNKCWQVENLRLSSGTVNSGNTHNPISNFAWTASSNSWCTDNNSTCYDKVVINTNNINSSLTASPTANNNSSSWYGYGTLYNWYSATAGNGTYEKSSGNVSGDICPLGWHLPTGTYSGELQTMYNAIGGTPASIRKYPNNGVLSGHWENSTAGNRMVYGFYWSATAYDNVRARYLVFGSTAYQNYNDKSYGRSARCVAG